MDLIQIISLTLGAAWASGINLYAAVLVLGYPVTGEIFSASRATDSTNPLVLGAAALMYPIHCINSDETESSYICLSTSK